MASFRKQNGYIATQGPLPETFGDYWKMVWCYKSAVIVMMTKLEGVWHIFNRNAINSNAINSNVNACTHPLIAHKRDGSI